MSKGLDENYFEIVKNVEFFDFICCAHSKGEIKEIIGKKEDQLKPLIIVENIKECSVCNAKWRSF